ncbi:MAG: ABC transporter substrate-binding protein [Candidatus Nanopelagicales bacterium]
MNLKSAAIATWAVALVMGMSGCSSSTGVEDAGAGESVEVAKSDALAAMVPRPFASDGVLTVGADASYAPGEFIDTDGESIIGFDVDLAEALGKVLGLTVEVRNAPFESLVEGVKTGKFDLGVSSFTIDAERQKQVDMVSYFDAGTSWAVPKGNPQGITPDNACGKKIAVQKATVQVPDIEARAKACIDAGKPAMTIEQYQLQSDATAAVVSGKDDAMLADSPVVAYAVKQTGDKLEVSGGIYDAAHYGIAVPKGQGDYAKAIQGALQQLMDDGAYMEILKSWGVQDGAISTSQINPVS